VLGQLGNRVQHALRAFTPRDQKAVKVAATTMRANPKLNLEQPSANSAWARRWCRASTPRAALRHRACLGACARQPIGPITDDERQALIAGSLVAGTYEKAIDRESAYEKLRGNAAASGTGTPGPATGGAAGGTSGSAEQGGWLDQAGEIFGTLTKGTGKTGRGDSILESMAKSAARTVGSQVGRELIRGVLGSLLGGGKRK
jgi:DNA helicase HerA-like ATPase